MEVTASVAEEGPAALRRILLNALSLLGAYVLPRACTFAAAIVAARLLGVEAFGIYGTAAALATMLSIATTLGMMQLLVRELARAPHRAVELMGAANVAKGLSALLMLGLLASILGTLGYTPTIAACALLIGLSYVLVTYLENLGAYFQAVERMEVWMQAQALFGVVSGSAAILLAVGTRSVVWFSAAPLLGQAVALAWLVGRAPAPVRRAWGAPWPVVAGLLRSLVPFLVYVVALTVYAKVDLLLVERWRGLAEAGIYAAAYKFVDVAHALALVVATALYPRLSRAAGGADEGRAATRTAELLLLAAVPAAALLWLLRGTIVEVVFGSAYGGAVPVLGLLGPVLPLLAFDIFAGLALAAGGRMGTVARLYGVALALNVGLNILFIPALGAPGAALARLGSEAALAVLMLGALRRTSGVAPSGRVVLAAGLAAGAAALVRWASLPPAAASVGYLAGTVGLYALVRVVPRSEWALLRRAVGR